MQTLFSLLWFFYPAALVSLVVSIIIVLTKNLHIGFTAKGHAGLEIQSSHMVPTPRIGGIAFMAGLITSLFLVSKETGFLAMVMLGAAVPVFLAGLAEDIGIGASPKKRLLAAMVSSLFMILLSGYYVKSGVAPGLDYLLGFAVIGGVFTIFITAAVCHAFNLVDGLNGLAMSIALLASSAMAIMALQTGDFPVAFMAGAIAASIAGVLLLNFPLGKIFLGDAGAYTLGFLVAWTGVLLITRNPEVSKWAVLLAVFWPFMDTTAAVLRRIRKKAPIGEPDKLHFHHVIKRVIDVTLSSAENNTIANPLATVAMLPFVALPPLLGILTAQSVSASLMALAFSICMYFAIKISIVRNFRRIGRAAGERVSAPAQQPLREVASNEGHLSRKEEPSQQAA
ncbi:MraY family glycosyltransferase [Shimia sediminis]|uniref:MraY family glycosyltransferase n=1 Tax=Shimia sediminis TaxID=2497945 RepID=UPI000F8E9180|nr:glycosyltransferase [Shimia sediminis]